MVPRAGSMTIRERLLAMLEVSDGSVSAAEVAARIGTSKGHANAQLRALKEQGLIEPCGAAPGGGFRWRLVAPARPQHLMRPRRQA